MLSSRTRDLVFNLLRQCVEFLLGEAQGFHVIAQHALRGFLHAFLQIIDLAASLFLELPRLAVEILRQRLA